MEIRVGELHIHRNPKHAISSTSPCMWFARRCSSHRLMYASTFLTNWRSSLDVAWSQQEGRSEKRCLQSYLGVLSAGAATMTPVWVKICFITAQWCTMPQQPSTELHVPPSTFFSSLWTSSIPHHQSTCRTYQGPRLPTCVRYALMGSRSKGKQSPSLDKTILTRH